MKSTKPDKGAKPPDKKKVAAKKDAPKVAAHTADEKRAARNVANIRNKLSAAMDDPHMREQIVRAMRSLINEGKS